METKLYIRDKNRKIFRVEESYSSLVWTERYQEAGDFVLDIPLKAANVEAYSIGNYISFDQSKESMIIESRSINDDYEEPLLEITGHTFVTRLNRVCNASRALDLRNGTISYSGELGDIISGIAEDDMYNPVMQVYDWMHDPNLEPIAYNTKQLIRGYYEPDNGDLMGYVSYDTFLKYNIIRMFVDPAPNRRKMTDISFDTELVKKLPINTNFNKVVNIYDLLVKMAKNNRFGFRSIIDDNDNMVVQLYAGINRDSTQKTLTPVVFSPIMDNITYINYFEDISNYKNATFIYSDGMLNYREKADDNVRARYELYPGYDFYSEVPEGSSRSEFQIPIDISSETSVASLADNPDMSLLTTDSSNSDGEESTESGEPNSGAQWYAYYDAIKEEVLNSGIVKFEDGEYDFVQTSEGAIDPLAQYTFEQDYNIGDKIDIQTIYGIVMTAYIDEAIKTFDNDGFVITPNFKNILDYDDGMEDE